MSAKPKVVGINHIALEVGNIDEVLDFYGRIFDFRLRGQHEGMAFIDMGDQFIALIEGRSQSADEARHFGLVVDDRSAVPELVRSTGAEMIEGEFMDFLDPWGNRIQVVQYSDLQFTKTRAVLQTMNLGHLGKTCWHRRIRHLLHRLLSHAARYRADAGEHVRGAPARQLRSVARLQPRGDWNSILRALDDIFGIIGRRYRQRGRLYQPTGLELISDSRSLARQLQRSTS